MKKDMISQGEFFERCHEIDQLTEKDLGFHLNSTESHIEEDRLTVGSTAWYDKQNDTKEDNQMSYVGIMTSNHGIVGFGDSKSSRQIVKNVEEDDYPVQKVFQFPKFILTNFGKNEYTDSNVVPCRLEYILKKYEETYEGTHKEFIQLLSKELKPSFGKEPLTNYTFAIGFYLDDLYEERIYGSELCALSSSGPSYSGLGYRGSLCWGGIDNYGPKNPVINPNWTITKMEEICRMFVVSAINLGDLCMQYNPVGGDVQIKSLT